MRSTALAVVLAGLLLAACGGSDEPGGAAAPPTGDAACPHDALPSSGDPVTISVWHAQVGMPSLTMQKIVDEYHDAQDRVRVELQFQGTYEEQLKKYEDAMADPGSLPAIVQPDDTATQFMADSGTVIPASACIDADPAAPEIYDDMVPIVPAAYRIDDVLWPGAYGAAGAALYANEGHFEAAGLDTAELPGTFEELRTTAEALRDAELEGVEAPLVMRIDSWPLEFWTTGAGQAVVDEDNGRTGLASESLYANEVTVEVLEFLDQLHDDGLLKYTDNADELGPFLAMATQSSSMLIDTSAAISTVHGAIEGSLTPEQVGLEDDLDLSGLSFPDLRITVGELPGLDRPGAGQMGGAAWYLVDTGDDATTAAAWDFMKFFNGTEQQVTWAIEASYFPVRRSAAEDPRLQEFWSDTEPGRWMAEAYRGFESLDPGFPGPAIGPYKEFRESVKGGLEAVILGDADIDDTVQDVAARFQQALDDYRRDLGA